uniref:hypothetical protein n=1 Tax=Caldifermentibacillus hisashii TaxID=996558 RepID=UPI003F685D70
MLEKAYQLLEKNYDHMVKIRRYLHQHPELSFKEFETAFYTTTKTAGKGSKQIPPDHSTLIFFKLLK